jgi:hypothetical protein
VGFLAKLASLADESHDIAGPDETRKPPNA